MLDTAIIGSPREPEVKRLMACLEKLGHPPFIIDTSAFPRQCHLSFFNGQWCYEGQDLSPLKAVFLRNFHCNASAEDLEQTHRQRVAIEGLREKDSMLGSLLRWMAAQGMRIVNPRQAVFCHYYKVDTLERLQQAGIPVPATIATNDPLLIQEFAQAYQELICKPLAGGAEAVALSADTLSPHFWARLQQQPVLLQQRIYGPDVRAYVLGEHVIAAAELLTDQVDFRTGPQPFQPTRLMEQESADLIKTAKLVALPFAGIDFKRTEDGGHFILDVNPAPMFAGFEKITGFRIADYLARYLVDA